MAALISSPSAARRVLFLACFAPAAFASGPPPDSSTPARSLSLPRAVAEAGGVAAWNGATAESAALERMLGAMVTASSVEDALAQVKAAMSLGHLLWAYAYMRTLFSKDPELYYATLLAAPDVLLPVVYTPTVGEACQKFGQLPLPERGCYVSLEHQGRVRDVLEEYARAHALGRRADGTYEVDAIVFTDGGRILGLGDLGAWGMGIPIGKLDLYTVCAGFDPRRTIPVLLDVGISDPSGNTARLPISAHPRYTGARRPREQDAPEPGGARVNTCFFGEASLVEEFMQAATQLFGQHVLLQFEDFNSNDAFPLLERTRGRFLTYNDDIQGTAAVTVAGILGALKLRNPNATDLVGQLRASGETMLFHGAGSANLGAASLLVHAAGVPLERIALTNSRGLLWRAPDATADGGGGGSGAGAGNFRNADQRALARVGRPSFLDDAHDLASLVRHVRPAFLVGAVGVAPGCFDRAVLDALLEGKGAGGGDEGGGRPTVFALSNPRTQAEVSAADAYGWTDGRVIYGSGTSFEPVHAGGSTRHPGQVNNVYCFPGISFGAVRCRARNLPDSVFLVAAEAVANSLDAQDIAEDRVVPHPRRIREVSLNVATAVVLECQRLGIAQRTVGASAEEVRRALAAEMWEPALTSRVA